MKFIKYIQLFNYLTSDEKLNPWSACRSIQRIRKLPKEYKEAVLDVLEGTEPDLEEHGVTIRDIREKDNMAPVRAILMLDWIRREPAVAARYMELESRHASQQVSENDQRQLEAALQRLKAGKPVQPNEDESDITIE